MVRVRPRSSPRSVPPRCCSWLFFVLESVATWLGAERKRQRGLAQELGGRRSARHALANGRVPAFLAFLAVAAPGQAPYLLLAFTAAFATAAADTVSSEVGQAYGRTTLLVTSLRPVPRGTDGGISLVGTSAGIAASAVVALAALWLGLVPCRPLVTVAIMAAFAGNLADSLLGATAQRAGWMDNESVNLAGTAAGGLAAIALARLLLETN
jgi:uncharacterized protein (TIGR00297 family)